MVIGTWTAMLQRRYAMPSGADDVSMIVTNDGVSLKVKRFLPRGDVAGVPVVCLPGLGTDSTNFDAPAPFGLARQLADVGFDVFVVDLRGTGGSTMARDRWSQTTFDDFVGHDVPAVLEHVCATTGTTKVALVGHSLGGTLAYAVSGDPRVGAVVAIAAPLGFPTDMALSALVRRLSPLSWAVPDVMGGVLGRLTVPLAFRMDVPVMNAWVVRANINPKLGRRVLFHAAQDLPRDLVRQVLSWINRDAVDSVDGGVDYRAALAGRRVPTLVVEAPLDGLATPASVRRALVALPHAEHFVAGIAGGCAVDYGHIDVMFGDSAPVDVYPRIIGFLAGVCGVHRTRAA